MLSNGYADTAYAQVISTVIPSLLARSAHCCGAYCRRAPAVDYTVIEPQCHNAVCHTPAMHTVVKCTATDHTSVIEHTVRWQTCEGGASAGGHRHGCGA